MQTVPLVRDLLVETSAYLSPDMPAFDAVDILASKNVAGLPVIDDAGRLCGFLTEKDCLRLLAVSHLYNMNGRRVSDIMSEAKEALRPDMDILTAAMRFLNCNFAMLPVLDGERLVGSITRQKVLQAIQRYFSERGAHIESGRRAQELQDRPASIDQLQILVARSNNAQLASMFAGRHNAGLS